MKASDTDRLFDLKAEEFSQALVHAIVATGGGSFTLTGPISDANGVDGFISKEEDGVAITDVIRVQVKSFRPANFKIRTGTETFPYDLKIKNYNKLCTAKVASALILVRIPPEKDAWLVAEEHIHFRMCKRCVESGMTAYFPLGRIS